MKSSKVILLTAAMAVVSLDSAPAAVIFSDTTGFADWYKGGSTTGTLTKGSDLAWTESGGAGAAQVIGRSFSSTTLAVGETMNFSFDWKQSTATVGILRVGLVDSTKTLTADGWNSGAGNFDGYYTFVRDASGSGNVAREEAASFAAGLMQAGSALASNSTNHDFVNDGTITYSVLYSVKRDTSSQITTTLVINEGVTQRFSLSGSDSVSAVSTFDLAAIRSAGGTMTLDNLKVEVIPEPRAALLGGLGLLALLRRRRA